MELDMAAMKTEAIMRKVDTPPLRGGTRRRPRMLGHATRYGFDFR